MSLAKTQRDAAIEHATKIKQVVHDPSSFLTELHVQQQQYYCLQWLEHFDVPAQVPLPPKQIAFDVVATRAKVPEAQLRSVARMAMTTGFMEEPTDGYLAHTALSTSFVEDVHMRTQLKHLFNATVPIMGGLVQATERWGETRAPNETAYNIANDTDLSFFEHLKARPDLQKNFENYMKSKAVSHTGSNADFLLQAFDWAALGDATVVDVGGSSGSTAIMLGTAHTRLNLIVEDLSNPIASAQSRIAELPAQLQSRIKAIEHDFFQPQPHTHADIYLLRTILHDWPNADAVRILKRTVDALGPTSRILIMDMVLPRPGSGSLTHEAALRQKDLTMLGVFNSKEREVDEWRTLLREADERLEIRAVKCPAGSELSVIEVGLRGGEVEKANGVASGSVFGQENGTRE